MRILILGASGRTGQLATAHALQQGHSVTALVRNPQALPTSLTSSPQLRIIWGSPESPEDMARVFSEAGSPASDPIGAVIVLLAVPRSSESLFATATHAPFFLRDCVRVVVSSMRQHGVRRLVVLSAFGTGASAAELPWAFRLVFAVSTMTQVIREHEAVEADLGEGMWGEGIQWTIVKPSMLNDREAGAVRQFGETGKGVGLGDQVSRESVARFMVDAVEGPSKGEAIVIAN